LWFDKRTATNFCLHVAILPVEPVGMPPFSPAKKGTEKSRTAKGPGKESAKEKRKQANGAALFCSTPERASIRRRS
jgi:hypothetical protein